MSQKPIFHVTKNVANRAHRILRTATMWRQTILSPKTQIFQDQLSVAREPLTQLIASNSDCACTGEWWLYIVTKGLYIAATKKNVKVFL